MNARHPPQRWYRVCILPLNVDLSTLLAYLRQRYIVHRVTEERQGQCLWVADPQAIQPLKDFIDEGGLQRLQPLEPDPNQYHRGTPQSLPMRLLILLNRFPVTLLTIYLGALGALLVMLDHQLKWVSLLTFQPLEIHGAQLQFGSLLDGLGAGQWWRPITPVFLHFGLFHILFNGLWVWEFGRRIEVVFGSARLIYLLLFLAIVSNAAQYLWYGPAMFGGLSGVLYGLLGFLWIYNQRRPTAALAIAPGIIGFMLLWQALCMSGIVDVFISGSIANGAHLGGLVAGMMVGFIAPNLIRRQDNWM